MGRSLADSIANCDARAYTLYASIEQINPNAVPESTSEDALGEPRSKPHADQPEPDA